MTPLHTVACKGYTAITFLLLEARSDPPAHHSPAFYHVFFFLSEQRSEGRDVFFFLFLFVALLNLSFSFLSFLSFLSYSSLFSLSLSLSRSLARSFVHDAARHQ